MRFLKTVVDLILFNPPKYISPKQVLTGASELGTYDKLSSALHSKEETPIFLLGEFGSGKTTHIRELIKNEKDFNFYELSFFSIRTLEEAYMKLVPTQDKFLTLVIGIVLTFITYQKFSSPPWTYIFPLLGIYFLSSKTRFVYIVSQIARGLGSRRIIIIDDLDRSSMAENEIWAFLAHLVQYKTKYIICLGFNTIEDRINKIAQIGKLNGRFIELPLNQRVTHGIIKGLYPEFPFVVHRTFESLNPRELIAIGEQVAVHSVSNSTIERKLIWIKLVFEKLKEKATAGDPNNSVTPTMNHNPFDLSISNVGLLDARYSTSLTTYRHSIDRDTFKNWPANMSCPNPEFKSVQGGMTILLRTPIHQWKDLNIVFKD